MNLIINQGTQTGKPKHHENRTHTLRCWYKF